MGYAAQLAKDRHRPAHGLMEALRSS